MIRHVVMFTWQDHVTDADIAVIAAALDALPGIIGEIGEYRHGRDLGLGPANHDYVVVGDFATIDDYCAYRDHPEHLRFIAEHIAGNVAERAAVQYEVDSP